MSLTRIKISIKSRFRNSRICEKLELASRFSNTFFHCQKIRDFTS